MNWYKIAQGYIANNLRTEYPYTMEEIIKMQGKNGLPLNTMSFQELKHAKELEKAGIIKKVTKQDTKGNYSVYIMANQA